MRTLVMENENFDTILDLVKDEIDNLNVLINNPHIDLDEAINAGDRLVQLKEIARDLGITTMKSTMTKNNR